MVPACRLYVRERAGAPEQERQTKAEEGGVRPGESKISVGSTVHDALTEDKKHVNVEKAEEVAGAAPQQAQRVERQPSVRVKGTSNDVVPRERRSVSDIERRHDSGTIYHDNSAEGSKRGRHSAPAALKTRGDGFWSPATLRLWNPTGEPPVRGGQGAERDRLARRTRSQPSLGAD